MFCSMWDRAMIARPPPLFARGKDLVAYPEGVRSAILASSPTPFNQVLTIMVSVCRVVLAGSDGMYQQLALQERLS